jgi:hypothetical protein
VAIVTRERSEQTTGYRSRAEGREVLGSVLARVEADARVGAVLKASRLRERLRLTDLGLTVRVSASGDPGRFIDWSFASGGEPAALSMSMDSDFANRWLQGRDSIAVAIARGQVRVKGGSGAALTHLPAMRLVSEHYFAVIRDGYPHLVVS